MALVFYLIFPILNFFLAKRKHRNPWLWAFLGFIFSFLSTAILALMGKSSRFLSKQAFNEALAKNNLSPDFIDEVYYTIAVDSKTKRLMLEVGDNTYRVYRPEEILSWGAGVDWNERSKNVYYKYFIEFRVTDLENPNPRAWFGGFNQERDKWLARITTIYTSQAQDK